MAENINDLHSLNALCQMLPQTTSKGPPIKWLNCKNVGFSDKTVSRSTK